MVLRELNKFGNPLSRSLSSIHSYKYFWDCNTRKKPVITRHKLYRSTMFSAHSPWVTLGDITSEGVVVSLFEKRLAQVEGFFTDTGILTNLNLKEANNVTAMFISPHGNNLVLGFKDSYIMVLPFLNKQIYIDRSTKWLCYGSAYSDGKSKTCSIRSVLKHPTRDLVYWLCKHGLYFKHCDTFQRAPQWKFVPRAHKNKNTFMKISATGGYLATSAPMEGVKVYDAITLVLKHHLLPTSTVAKAFDWHPWTSNLLVVGEWDGEGRLSVFLCSKQNPLVGEIFHGPCRIFVLSFHPCSGELAYAQWIQDEEEDSASISENSENMKFGNTTIAVLDGYGKIVDASDSHSDLVTRLFWGPNGSQLLTAGVNDNIRLYNFTKASKPRGPVFKNPSLIDLNSLII